MPPSTSPAAAAVLEVLPEKEKRQQRAEVEQGVGVGKVGRGTEQHGTGQNQRRQQSRGGAEQPAAELVGQQHGQQRRQRRRQPGRELVDAAVTVGKALHPVEQGRLVNAELKVEGGHYPVARFAHLAGGLGVVALVNVPQAGRPG